MKLGSAMEAVVIAQGDCAHSTFSVPRSVYTELRHSSISFTSAIEAHPYSSGEGVTCDGSASTWDRMMKYGIHSLRCTSTVADFAYRTVCTDLFSGVVVLHLSLGEPDNPSRKAQQNV
eukprot:IDg15084t1